MQPTDFGGSVTGGGGGGGGSKTCPRGVVDGLVYGPDTNGGPFRSTGDIGGPCGVGYMST